MQSQTRTLTTTLVLKVVLPLLLIAASGCSGSSNDQGVFFTALGFYSEGGDGSSDDFPPGLAGVSSPLSDPTPENLASFSGGITGFIGLQNNSPFQTLRVQGVHLSYFVEGATISIPDTFQALGSVLGPIATEDAGTEGFVDPVTGASSSLPGAAASIPNRTFAQMFIVPAEIRSFLILNKANFPEAPFTMVVTAQATGISSAGDSHDSNPIVIFVQFTPEPVVPPTAGSFEDSDTTDGGDTGGV